MEYESYSSDSYSSCSSSDSDNSVDEVSTKYKLVLCHIYHDKLHGTPKNANVLTHYLVIEMFKNFNIIKMQKMADFYNLKYKEQDASLLNHKVVRNYRAIVSNGSVKPEIAECFELPDQECVCIKKTIWLRLIQRAWKRVFKERMHILKKMAHPLSVINRLKTHTKSPVLPGLRGLLVCK